MGHCSPEKLKDKWKKQQAKRKLFTKQDVPTCLDIRSNDTVQEDYHGDSDTCTSAFGNIAIDIDVIEMALYDLYKQVDGAGSSCFVRAA